MYDLPTMENVSKVVIDEPTIQGDGKPLLIYSDAAQGRRFSLLSAAGLN